MEKKKTQFLKEIALKSLVRPKGLEPLLQASEACVISASLRAQQLYYDNTFMRCSQGQITLLGPHPKTQAGHNSPKAVDTSLSLRCTNHSASFKVILVSTAELGKRVRISIDFNIQGGLL